MRSRKWAMTAATLGVLVSSFLAGPAVEAGVGDGLPESRCVKGLWTIVNDEKVLIDLLVYYGGPPSPGWQVLLNTLRPGTSYVVPAESPKVAWDVDTTPDGYNFVETFRKTCPSLKLYENYRWQDLSPYNSAMSVMNLSSKKFIIEASSPWHDSRLNWGTDYCSGPAVVDLVWVNNFFDACRRHDFGYRNFGGTMQLREDAEHKTMVDDVFLADMTEVCKKQFIGFRPSCMLSAAAFYDAVHFSLWGHNAFFN